MSRPRTLNEREFEICRRLASFRMSLGATRGQASLRCGVDSAQLERFELCRSPVRLAEALAFARAFHMNLFWLGNGRGSPHDYFGSVTRLFEEIESSATKPLLLSQAIDSPQIATIICENRLRFANAHVRWFAKLAANGSLDKLSEETLDQLNDAAIKAANEMARLPLQELDRLLLAKPEIDASSSESEGKPSIRSTSGTGIACLEGVNLETSHWELLRERLRAVTQARGAQKALAQAFGVAQQSVSQWLTGDSVPTAENALRLVEWVTAAEAKQQQKTPPVLLTRTGQVTQPSKSKANEKAKPDRPEG
jgi:transcriptional regulator with XRE-family HTH domain